MKMKTMMTMTRQALPAVLLVLALAPAAAAEGLPDPKEKAGYALLDLYVKSFQEMATKGTGGAEVLDGYLAAMAKELQKARAEKAVDPVFDARFARMLALTKLFVRPDPEGILKPVIDRELAAFLRDVTGEDPMQGGGPARIGQVANALAEEIVNLQIHLDTKGTREALRRKLEGRIAGTDK